MTETIRLRVKPALIPQNATIAVGETTTLAAGEDATVTNSGTPSAVVLEFGIPQGDQGPAGANGLDGADGADGADGTDGIMASVVAGSGIDVDATDPANPIVSVEANLQTWNGLAPSANAQSLVTAANYAAMRALLDLEAGTDFYSIAAANAAFQPIDADLTSWAGVTRAAGFDTFVATPSSANLASLVTGETGSGALMFGTSPSVTTDIRPASNDGASLGISGTAFADLFLASGGVINWNAGNATLTHSAGLLTSNVAFSVGTSLAITAGTIELGAASDTTLSRASAGVLAVEGVNVLTTATGQPLDATLTALAAFNSNGVLTQTAADTFAARTITGTANEIDVTNGNGVSGNPTLALAAAAKATGRQEYWISAGAMKPRASSGAAEATYDSGSNDVTLNVLDFDQTSAEHAHFEFGMPNGWNEGTVTFIPYWTADAGTATQTCIFSLAGVAISNDDVMNASMGTAQTSSDALIATGDLHIGPESSAITIAGTPAANDLVVFQVARDISDTLAADARLIGIKLVLTFTAANDA